ncbi:unnamed protein product, partial [Polarella glacialis]
MTPPPIGEVKKSLNFIWGKESDLNETYSFEFSAGDSWGCTRKNAEGSRKFKLTFEAAACRIWWGQSYFTDPSDLQGKPERVQWYRTSDKTKKKAAFLWKKLRAAAPGSLEANQTSKASSAKPSVTTRPSTASAPAVRAKAEPGRSDAQPSSKATLEPKGPRAQKPSSPNLVLPEVILDLDN